MTTTINASPTNGLVQTADGSGVLKVQSNGKTTNALAWVNFNGTGTVAIRSAYNVSSITDNGAGDYTVNFTTALSDANYSSCASASFAADAALVGFVSSTTSALRITTDYVTSFSAATTPLDAQYVNIAIFGN